MTNVIELPVRFRENDSRPYLEATNEAGTWSLYIVSGYNGDYRKIATFVDYPAVEAFFAHRAQGR